MRPNQREADFAESATGCIATQSRPLASHRDKFGGNPHILRIAKDLGADLIVASAFGHGRFRAWPFGGVTLALLVKAERCALVSH
jgi:nucleotide-binding universal stress UspA family protein